MLAAPRAVAALRLPRGARTRDRRAAGSGLRGRQDGHSRRDVPRASVVRDPLAAGTPRGRRGLPRAKNEPLFGEMVELRFTVLAEDPSRKIVAGAVAQVWKRGGEAA